MWEQLVAAVRVNNLAEVERILGEMSANDLVKDYSQMSYGALPLHIAATRGDTRVIELLLNKSVNYKSTNL